MPRQRLSIACALSLVLAAASAAAQEGPTSAPVADARAEAQLRFFAGRALYDAGRFADALVEFRGSFKLSPSPNSRLYVARCLRETGDLGGAYEEYAQVIQASSTDADAAKYAGTERAATDERAALREKLAFVILVLPADVAAPRVELASKPVESPRFGVELPVPAGHVSVRAEAEGRAPFVATLDLAPSETRRVVIDLAPPAAAPVADATSPPSEVARRPSALLYVSSAAAVVGITTSVALGLDARSRYESLSRVCAGRCTPGLQGEIDGGRAESAVATAGLVLGLTGLAGGAVSWWLGSRAEAAPQVTARLAPTPGGLVVSGTFR